jgi:hypothetical protein
MARPTTPEGKARSARDRSFPRCAEPSCNNVAGLNETYCGKHRPTFIHYETDAMHTLRQLLIASGFSDDDATTFRECLVTLERNGFKLKGPVQ